MQVCFIGSMEAKSGILANNFRKFQGVNIAIVDSFQNREPDSDKYWPIILHMLFRKMFFLKLLRDFLLML